MKSSMGAQKYKNLAAAALTLLSIPTSNADCERVFSHVQRIKTDFRSSLSTETISSLIGCQFNKIGNCVNMQNLKTLCLLKQNSVRMNKIYHINVSSSTLKYY